VLGGIFDAKILMKSKESSGEIMSLYTEFQGSEIEASTAFGQDLHSALQILDPADFATSLPGSLHICEEIWQRAPLEHSCLPLLML
jgi:hypothetical protein